MGADLPTRPVEQAAIPGQIVRAYLACVLNATAIKQYAIHPRGNITQRYLEFYESFDVLFTLTSAYRDIAGDESNSTDLVKEIRAWLAPENSHPAAQSHALRGVRLFDQWQGVLGRKGVISWR